MPLPDLFAMQLGPADGTVYRPGEIGTISYIVSNYVYGVSSGGDAPRSVTGVYLSTDNQITTSDLLIGTSSVIAIPYGYYAYNLTISFHIPDNISPGGYTIGLITDYNNAIAESDETNNDSTISSSFITIKQPQPDLDTDAYHLPTVSTTNAIAGSTITFSYDLDNLGAAQAPGSLTGIYLSTDSTISTSDRLIATASQFALPAGWYTHSDITLTLPSDLAPGVYYLGAVADFSNAIQESNESNNPSIGIPITITAPIVDLTFSSTPNVGPDAFYPGGQLLIDYQLTNSGNAAAAPSKTAIYLSTDDSIDSNDRLLIYIDQAAINAGATADGSIAMGLPDDVAPGTYYIGLVADSNNAISESNETNNASVGVPITITPAGPDLHAAGVQVDPPAAAVAGHELGLSYIVGNNGTAGTAATTIDFYISTDAVFSEDDILLGSQPVAGLAAGGSLSLPASFVLSPDLPTGSYHIVAVVDPSNTVNESNEANNEIASTAFTIFAQPFTEAADTVLLPLIGQTWNALGGNDFVIGTAGDDIVHGGTGDDTIFGDSGTDTLFGDDGNDILVGGDGADIIHGGAGDDIIEADSIDTLITGDDGFDTVSFTDDANVSFDLGAAAVEQVLSRSGNDTLIADSQTARVGIYSGDGDDVVHGGANDDIIFAGAGSDTLVGGNGNDVLIAGDGVDNIAGGAGNDVIEAASVDSVQGGEGFDYLYLTDGVAVNLDMAAAGVEWLFTVGGNSIIDASGLSTPTEVYAGSGNDTLIGGASVDALWGGAGDDVIQGGLHYDNLNGQAGADRLIGGQGIDTLIGGLNDGAVDTYVYTTDAVGLYDYIYEFENGVDRIEFNGIVGLDSAAQLTIVDGGGNAEIYNGAVTASSLMFVVVGAAGQLDADDFLFT